MRILDLFSGAGGAGMGYHRAGFEVVGVDNKPQPNYPFEFHQADALDYLQEHALEFDAIHASPPCQLFTAGNRANITDHLDLVTPARKLLVTYDLPYVIENVAGAPLRNPALFCGRTFALSTIDDDGTFLQMDRHRLFETNFGLVPPPHIKHDRTVQVAGSYGGARRDKWEARHIRKGGYVPSKQKQAELLGIDWMEEKEMYQAIPPVYTEYIGQRLGAIL